MSFESARSAEHGQYPKRRIQRRHGACEPCRASKAKCDGKTPCGACRSDKRCQRPCTYSEKAMKLRQVVVDRIERDPHLHQSPANCSGKHANEITSTDIEIAEGPRSNESQTHGRPKGKDENTDTETRSPFIPLSLCGTVEEFKNMKPVRHSAAQVLGRCNGFEVIDLSISTSPIVVRTDKAIDHLSQIPAFTTSIDEISAIKHWLDAIRATVSQGRLRRAWIDLASLVREAEFFNTSDALKSISSDERTEWKQLWTNILDLESQVGLTLGCPTCVLPRSDDSNQNTESHLVEQRELDGARLDLFKHIHSVLSLSSKSSKISSDFHDRAKLILLHEPFHKVGLCTTEDSPASTRNLQLDTHLLFMVIYCRLASMCGSHAREGLAPICLDTEVVDNTRHLAPNQPQWKLVYCRMMCKSARFVVNIFLNLLSNDREAMGQNWTRCHSAFIAATLLGIAKLRHEVEWNSTTDLLRKLEHAFSELSQTNPTCSLFTTAIQRLQDLNSIEEPTSEIKRNKHSGVKHRGRHTTSSAEAKPSTHHQEKTAWKQKQSGYNSDSSSRSPKRIRTQVTPISELRQSRITPFGNDLIANDEAFSPPIGNLFYTGFIDPMSHYQDNSGMFPQATSFLSGASASTATSFCGSEADHAAILDMTTGHSGPPYAYPFPYELTQNMALYNSAILPEEPVLLTGTGGVQAPSRVGPNHVMNHLSVVTQPQNLERSTVAEYYGGINITEQSFKDYMWTVPEGSSVDGQPVHLVSNSVVPKQATEPVYGSLAFDQSY